MGISKNLAGPSEGRFCTHDRLQRGKTDSSGHFLRLTAANVECCSKWARETKKAAEVDRSRLSLYHTISVSFAFFFRSLELAKVATLQTHFRGRGGLIQNLAIEAEFLHHFFCASLPFGQSRFVAKNLIFSRPDFFAKKNWFAVVRFFFLPLLFTHRRPPLLFITN